jgi:two-component system chemotaxis response regulator CheB
MADDRPIRVMVVEDSVITRRLLAELLASEPGLELCGSAANGRIALDKIDVYKPDVLTLDIEMPELDGLSMLSRLRLTHPRLPVIMLSSTTQRGAAATLEALNRGASDWVGKPAGDSLTAALRQIREELIPRIRALAAPRDRRPSPVALARHPSTVSTAPSSWSGRVDIVAIGASTGGPQALTTVLSSLPVDFPTPIVIAQHMPPVFTRLLAERLAIATRRPVVEGAAGMTVGPGQVVIAPGGLHLTVSLDPRGVRLGTDEGRPRHSCRPSVDVLFESVAESFGAAALGVVLTGMGQDGLAGAREVYDRGGAVLAQDEQSSVVWGMPGYVARAGIAAAVLPLEHIGREIWRHVQRGRVRLRQPG